MFKSLIDFFTGKKQAKARAAQTESITYFNKNMANEDKSELIRIQACARLKQGDLTGALRKAFQAVELCQEYYPSLITRAEVYRELGESAAALKDIKKAIKLSNDDDTCWEHYLKIVELFEASDEVKRVHEEWQTLRAARKAFMEKPLETAREYIDRSQMKMNKGDYTGSLYDLNQAVLLEPENSEVHSLMGTIKHLMGDADSGKSNMSRAGE